MKKLAMIAVLVSLCVIVLGAYVRLSHAGLGCPDWPGCYGKLTWPSASHELESANQAFPERPVESDKAWKEMVHRYLAGILVMLVMALNLLAWRPRNRSLRMRGLAAAILVLIVFQAALGMWTVTLKLKPIIVMAHLMGGMATLSLLLWFFLRCQRAGHYSPATPWRNLRGWVLAGLGMLLLQISLGGWVSANYSALACPDFPTCQNQWWPDADFAEGFRLWREIGVDYEGGILDLDARIAVHQAHRIGAVVTFALLAFLSLRLLRNSVSFRSGIVLGALLITQVTLGVLNVVLFLPLPNAAAHNGVAALLLATLVWLLFRTTPRY